MNHPFAAQATTWASCRASRPSPAFFHLYLARPHRACEVKDSFRPDRYGAHAIRGCATGDAATDAAVRRLIAVLSVCSATLFGLVEIVFCHRLHRLSRFGSAHLAIEAFVVVATVAFSRAAERVVRRIPRDD